MEAAPLALSFPGPPGSIGRLVVHVTRPLRRLQYGLARVPMLSINGQPAMPISESTTVIDLPAGYYHLATAVHIERATWWKYGKASIAVMVHPGRTTTVYYGAPLTEIGRGRIGLVPQTRWFIDSTPYLVIAAFTLFGSLAFMIVLILLYGD